MHFMKKACEQIEKISKAWKTHWLFFPRLGMGKDSMKIILQRFCLVVLLLPLASHAAGRELILSPPADGTDAVPQLRTAIAQCHAEGIRRLVLGTGVWQLYPEKAEGEFRHVSNHDPGYKRMALHLDGFNNFEVDGQGATLLCHGVIMPIAVDRSKNIILHKLVIDWDKPFHLEGTVVAIGEDCFEVEMLPECEVELRNGKLLGGLAEGFFGEEQQPKEARQDLRWNYWVDPASRAAAAVQSVLKLWNPRTHSFAEVTQLATNRFRIRNAHIKALPSLGSVMVCKGMHRPNRLSPAIHLASVENATIADITIHHAGGMGVIAEDCTDTTIRDVHVTLKAGSKSLVTTTADATHFVQCRGMALVEGCLFENMLDDGCNVHGIYAITDSLPVPNRLAVRFLHFQHLGMVFAHPGDRLRLLDRKTLQGYAEFSVKEIHRPNESFYELVTDQSLAGILHPDSIVENMTARPNFIFRNNTVRNNRGRSVLVNPARALVENNVFERPSMTSILIEGDSNYWMSSGSPDETIIRHNHIIGLFPTFPLIMTVPAQQKEDQPPLPPLYQILQISGNVMESPGMIVMDVRRIAHVEFTDNAVQIAAPAQTAIRLVACEAAILRNNKFDHPASIQTKPETMSLQMEKNENLKHP